MGSFLLQVGLVGRDRRGQQHTSGTYVRTPTVILHETGRQPNSHAGWTGIRGPRVLGRLHAHERGGGTDRRRRHRSRR